MLYRMCGMSAWFCSCHPHCGPVCPLWCRDLLLITTETWHSVLCVCLEQWDIFVIISWWFWVLPGFSGCSLFCKSVRIWSCHLFVVLSTFVYSLCDKLDWVPFVGHHFRSFGGRQMFFVLLIILSATWYIVRFGPQCPLWSRAHDGFCDIAQVDMSQPECLLSVFKDMWGLQQCLVFPRTLWWTVSVKVSCELTAFCILHSV